MADLVKFFCFLSISFAILLFLNLISNILLPFVSGLILAYFLDPAASKLERKGCSRSLATTIILILFILIIVFFIYLVGPILYSQAKTLAVNLPLYITKFEIFLTPYAEVVYAKVGYTENINLLGKIANNSLIITQKIFSNILQSSIAVLNLFSLLILTPIVTFYLLRDWHKLLANIMNLIPLKFKKDVLTNFVDIDRVLSAYIRGQTNVCLILGSFYAISLTLFGLNQGFLIGFFTGLFSFVPYFGVAIGMIIGVAVAFFQFDSYLQILAIFLVFLVGQFLEGNFITPKLVGSTIGVHPVLIIFSLLVGATLFGFLGILFSIPAIAVLSVIVRFMIKNYMRSKFFLAK